MICALSLFIVTFAERKIRREKRKQWCKEWLQRRNKLTQINLLNELRNEPSDYKNFLQINELVYNEWLSLVSPLIKKKDTNESSYIPTRNTDSNFEILGNWTTV